MVLASIANIADSENLPMWEMVLLLWLVPLALAVVALARLIDGSPPVTDDESRQFFGDDKEIHWSAALLIALVAIGVVFFGIGFFEGLVVSNFASFWIVAAPLMTAIAAILILRFCLRFASHQKQIPARETAQWLAHARRFTDFFSR
jgi:fatty acid desaturase